VQFYRPNLINPDRHRRDEFASGDSSMDEWLRRYAGQNRRGNTAAVWVIADADHRAVCYATLSMTSVDRSASPTPLAKAAPLQVPALLVGRLATDTRVTGLGLGTQMVEHILATAAELNVKAACRAVVVTGLNPAAFSWWQRFGFDPFDAEDSTNLDLYLLTKDIGATLARL
jgi:GNAT superfamily N-acetyltransferase